MNLHAEIFTISTMAVTGWKLIGWAGAFCFSLRWFVQVWHRARTRMTDLPRSFWWISVAGSGMALAYFIFGQEDSVGIIQNALPLALASWNLIMDGRAKKSSTEA